MSRTFTYNAEHVAERLVRNEVVLVPVTSAYGQIGNLLDLNEMAAIVWNRAKSGESEAQIIEALIVEFDAAEDEVSADVKAVLDELVAFGALVAAD